MTNPRHIERPGRLLATLLLCAALAAVGGCGGAPRTPQEAMANLAVRLGDTLHDGWQVGRVKDVRFKVMAEQADVGDLLPYHEGVGGDDLIVWRTEPVQLQERPDLPTPEARTGHVYFVLSGKDFIDPDQYAQIARSNDEALQARRWLVRDVANVSRDGEGNLRPRGAAESGQVGAFRNKYAKLPPCNPFLPQHHYEGAAIRLRDYRTVLVPVDKDHRQDMNQVYVEIVQLLTPYRQQ